MQGTVNSEQLTALALALLVLGVFADDADDTLAMDDLALVADRFY